jgi:hypothetical protein
MNSSSPAMMTISSPAPLSAASLSKRENYGGMILPCSTAQVAASFNEQGIQFLVKSKYKEAYLAFSRGLSLVKQSIACFDDNDDEAMDITAAPSGASICCFTRAQAPTLKIKKSCTEDQMTDDESAFLFPHPMAVADTAAIHHQAEEEVSYTHYIELSFMLLYNLALCHHLSATMNSSDSSSTSRQDFNRVQEKLQKALHLYELAYTISLTEQDCSMLPEGEPTTQFSILQQLALVNNLGHVHAALGNIECSRQCFQNLLSTLMVVRDCGEQIEKMDGFLSNVMNLINNNNNSNNCPTLAAAA